MGEVLPVLYVARHGETAWSLSGQHTPPYRLTSDSKWRVQRPAARRAPQGHDICQGVYQPVAARGPNL